VSEPTPATTTCPLCGLVYEPGGEDCRAHGCPLAAAGCRTLHCPRCGYTIPDERASVLARWLRRLLPEPREGERASTLAELGPGARAVVAAVGGDSALRARLTAQGLAPGVVVRLVQRTPAFVVDVGETTLAFERRVAEAITLRTSTQEG
jgi:Fe2+ transport system protein FeoA